MTIAPVRNPKPGTWYYGARCACSRLLAVCEDLFGGNGADLLPVPVTVALQCECGMVSHVLHFEKFKAP